MRFLENIEIKTNKFLPLANKRQIFQRSPIEIVENLEQDVVRQLINEVFIPATNHTRHDNV
jgi:hypothetical protein